MSLFSSSDKSNSGQSYIDPETLGLIDVNREFKTHLGMEDTLFNRFSAKEVHELLTESGMFEMLEFRGFKKTKLEIQGISEVDNRIYIKTEENEILVHMRLKFSDFLFKKIKESFPMIYIDWLLSQNVKLGKLGEKKKLFEGQEYPGLNIMNEITSFIRLVSGKLGAAGAFNIPESKISFRSHPFRKNFRSPGIRSILLELRRNGVRNQSVPRKILV